MKGTTGYLAVYFQGYPNNNTIQAFNNGTNITNLTSKALEDEYTKNGNIVTGYIKYYSVPLSYVSSGTFSFSATGLNGSTVKQRIFLHSGTELKQPPGAFMYSFLSFREAIPKEREGLHDGQDTRIFARVAFEPLGA